jgi:hypothetical protein
MTSKNGRQEAKARAIQGFFAVLRMTTGELDNDKSNWITTRAIG